ncbi:hemolysin family protein [Agrococcus sp. SL85]|uniref:hemolysin family protein n=1 Tax=Agrococcus sp. SL85 TaxID=2995141 RepID=UPI00226CAA88|nr:hemolysin family protein [Agrococcus sp. SL85]WAC65586.1 hemolysin family protein [Agrococcus sp. SL85]
MNDWLGILWLVILLAANAFFVGAEFAVISARRSQIEPLADRGNRAARLALYAMEHVSLMLAMCQLGITICSLLILNVSEPAIHHLLEGPLSWTGLSEEVVSVTAFVIALLLVTYLHVVLGEMVPKNAAFSVPDRAVLLLAPPLVLISRIFRPIIWLMNAIANGILRLFRVEPVDEAASAFTIDEVETIVETSKREGVLFDPTGAISRAFEFTERRVRDVALPLDEIVSLPQGATTADVERAVRERGFSRYVITDAAGGPVGYVHIKDVLGADDDEVDEPVPSKRIRQLASIYQEAEVEDALALMRSTGAHVARSFDAQGETTGLLFLEDIIEELVGEVRDATRRLF